MTQVPHTPGTVAVTISGLPYEGLVDTKGRALRFSPMHILMHELVGHAIPRVAGSDSGNAIQNENKVRQEMTPGIQRPPDPAHVEYPLDTDWGD